MHLRMMHAYRPSSDTLSTCCEVAWFEARPILCSSPWNCRYAKVDEAYFGEAAAQMGRRNNVFLYRASLNCHHCNVRGGLPAGMGLTL